MKSSGRRTASLGIKRLEYVKKLGRTLAKQRTINRERHECLPPVRAKGRLTPGVLTSGSLFPGLGDRQEHPARATGCPRYDRSWRPALPGRPDDDECGVIAVFFVLLWKPHRRVIPGSAKNRSAVVELPCSTFTGNLLAFQPASPSRFFTSARNAASGCIGAPSRDRFRNSRLALAIEVKNRCILEIREHLPGPRALQLGVGRDREIRLVDMLHLASIASASSSGRLPPAWAS